MNTDQTLDAVRGEWWAAGEYELFIGPPCVECGRRACTSPACLASIRSAVAGTQGVKEIARMLGVES